jgi:hypothetical protein
MLARTRTRYAQTKAADAERARIREERLVPIRMNVMLMEAMRKWERDMQEERASLMR